MKGRFDAVIDVLIAAVVVSVIAVSVAIGLSDIMLLGKVGGCAIVVLLGAVMMALLIRKRFD